MEVWDDGWPEIINFDMITQSSLLNDHKPNYGLMYNRTNHKIKESKLDQDTADKVAPFTTPVIFNG